MRARDGGAGVFVSVLLFAGAAFALGSEPSERSRVTIRGTGRDIVVDREATRRPRALAGGPLSRSAVDEALRRKERGASDAEVVAYLRAHRSRIPDVIGAGDLRRLRNAGAGKAVGSYLAGVAAVDLGLAGEGAENSASNASAPREAPLEPEMYVPSYGPYPAEGYVVPYGAPGGRLFSPRRSPHHRRPLSHPRRFPR